MLHEMYLLVSLNKVAFGQDEKNFHLRIATFVENNIILVDKTYLFWQFLNKVYEKYLLDRGNEVKPKTKSLLFEYMEKKYKLCKINGYEYFKGLRLKTWEEIEEENDEDIVNVFKKK